MSHKIAAALAVAAITLTSVTVFAQAWKDDVPVFRVGLIGGENVQDRLMRYDEFKNLLSERLGVPVELFAASDYAGVMQAQAAGQLEAAAYGASAYAGAWLDCQCIEPVVVAKENDGSTGYYSVMYALADSGIQSLEDMKGHSLAFADPNSTSGYLVPRAMMEGQGIDIDTYFSTTGFGGGHEQAVVAVLQGQYEAGVTWTSLQGDLAEGYSRGNLHEMVAKGMLDMSQIRIIWESPLIPNGPWAIRTDLPRDLRDAFRAFMIELPTAHRQVYEDVERGGGQGYEAVGHDFFKDIIEMREREMNRRS